MFGPLSQFCVLFFLIMPWSDMIFDDEPLVIRYVSTPKDMRQLNCATFVAGIIEAILDASEFVRSRLQPRPQSMELLTVRHFRFSCPTVSSCDDAFPRSCRSEVPENCFLNRPEQGSP